MSTARVAPCVLKQRLAMIWLIVTALSPVFFDSAIVYARPAMQASPGAEHTAKPIQATTQQMYRKLIQESEQRNDPPARQGYLWAVLAASYHDIGNIAESQRAYEHALPLLAQSPQSRGNYATALDNLGSIYLELGNIADAEKVRTQAFHLREEIGNPIDLARGHEHLAEVLLARHRFKEAEQHARAAYDTLSAKPEPDDMDAPTAEHPQYTQRRGNTMLAALITLVFAECNQSELQECLQAAKQADQIATQEFASGSLEQAHAAMALGFAQWKTGDVSTADQTLRSGMAMMKARLGEGHPLVLDSMYEYREFLQAQHRKADLSSLDHQIKDVKEHRPATACANCTISVFALR
ncbi:tetratricopeptide repeat protein [Terriglobus albidus]|uniref:Tetratricopeptide repeat protein n=1 Tax=Terriglobus albidus TaxID=1592106 RepID=A0A5B9EJZ1_9BACT|nr:tetratricopeptide repeat protein [Terriglobus albidus]QEE30641.1 tetratricopeptide repeat protein [Terriglobus albidus]